MKKTTLAFALCALGALGAQPAWAQGDEQPGYLAGLSGPVRSGSGLCWHTGGWTPAQAVAECDPVAVADGAAAARVSVPVAETPKREERIEAPSPRERAPVAERTELDGAVHFAFGRSELTPQGKTVIDDLAARALAGQGRVSVAIVTGHADRIGASGYNHGLALRRASAVAERLVSRGIPSAVQKVGEKGQSEPIVDCPGSASRSVVACLAPNRRVEVVVMVERGGPALREVK